MNESSKCFIHSGLGDSYVKYIQVKKGDVFYLLLDNVYSGGNGHSIRFHNNPFKPEELYVGKLIPFEHISFQDSDTEFKPGSEKALDSLYLLLINNPFIKIEIQGHVNSSGQNTPMALPGKPAYTDLQLSQQRALAIYKFLLNKGIDPDRLTTIGYGGTRKKIHNPKNKKECSMNIRAEILVLSLDYKKDLVETKNNNH